MLYWHERVDKDAANRWLRAAVLDPFGDQAPRQKLIAA